MLKSVVIITLLFTLADAVENLPLSSALEIAKRQNLSLSMARLEQKIKSSDVDIAQGYRYGKLDATISALRSNDAGNVFGFKLQSREASFGDFGFDQFMSSFGAAMMDSSGNLGDFENFAANLSSAEAQAQLLNTEPDALNYPGDRNHFDVKLSYQVPLYTAGKLGYYKNIAQNMHLLSSLDREQVALNIEQDVKKAYYDISLLTSLLKDLTKMQTNISKLKDSVEQMQLEGYAKNTDILEVESKLSNVTRMLDQSRSYRELSYQFLSFLLNERVDSIEFVDLDSAFKLLSKESILQNSTDIKKAKLGVEIHALMLKVAKSAYYRPEVGAFVEYGSSDDQFLNQFFDHDRYTAGLQLNYNLFNGGVDRAKVEQQRLALLKSQQQMQLAKEGIALKASKILTQISNLDLQIQSLRKELELAEQIYNSYQERYKEGLSSINDTLIKQSLHLQKILELKESQNRRQEAVLQLLKLAQE